MISVWSRSASRDTVLNIVSPEQPKTPYQSLMQGTRTSPNRQACGSLGCHTCSTGATVPRLTHPSQSTTPHHTHPSSKPHLTPSSIHTYKHPPYIHIIHPYRKNGRQTPRNPTTRAAPSPLRRYRPRRYHKIVPTSLPPLHYITTF